MTYLTIILAVLNVTFLVMGVIYFRPIGNVFGRSWGREPDSVESDAERSASFFKTIKDALSAHANNLNDIELSGINADDRDGDSGFNVEEIRRCNRETGGLLDENNAQLASLLTRYGDLYRSERQRIDSYAQNVDELDDQLCKFEQDAEGSNQILLSLVRNMLQENRQLQAKVSDCQEQVSELIVRSVKSEQEARTDVLTRLPNRLAWDECLSDLSSETSIALIDVDDFKRINDGYGHAAGDAMLTMIGTILRNIPNVSAYRIGGDEFAVLISPGCEEQVAEQIRKKIAVAVLNFSSEKISVSVSIGIASREDNDLLHNVVRRADGALYKAKKSKGNQVQTAQLAE